jgi:hypothetical protein
VTGPVRPHPAGSDAGAGTEQITARIEASLARLTGPDGLSNQPLPVAASMLEELHSELQTALTDLDRS